MTAPDDEYSSEESDRESLADIVGQELESLLPFRDKFRRGLQQLGGMFVLGGRALARGVRRPPASTPWCTRWRCSGRARSPSEPSPRRSPGSSSPCSSATSSPASACSTPWAGSWSSRCSGSWRPVLTALTVGARIGSRHRRRAGLDDRDRAGGRHPRARRGPDAEAGRAAGVRVPGGDARAHRARGRGRAGGRSAVVTSSSTASPSSSSSQVGAGHGGDGRLRLRRRQGRGLRRSSSGWSVASRGSTWRAARRAWAAPPPQTVAITSVAVVPRRLLHHQARSSPSRDRPCRHAAPGEQLIRFEGSVQVLRPQAHLRRTWTWTCARGDARS